MSYLGVFTRNVVIDKRGRGVRGASQTFSRQALVIVNQAWRAGTVSTPHLKPASFHDTLLKFILTLTNKVKNGPIRPVRVLLLPLGLDPHAQYWQMSDARTNQRYAAQHVVESLEGFSASQNYLCAFKSSVMVILTDGVASNHFLRCQESLFPHSFRRALRAVEYRILPVPGLPITSQPCGE